MKASEVWSSPAPASERGSRTDPAQMFRRPQRWLSSLVVLAVVTGGGIRLLAQGRPGSPLPGPQPAFGDLTAAPPNFTFGTPTAITFTIRIDTPTLNPTAVELQRLDADGIVIAVIGRMYDNGRDGDVKPGDRIFTKTLVLDKPTVGTQYYQVGAVFRGNRQNAFSNVLTFEVWQPLKSSALGLTLFYPADWVVRDAQDEGGLVISNVPSGWNSNPASLAGVCKTWIGERQKPEQQTLTEWRIASRTESLVSASLVTVGLLEAVREIAEEVNRTDTFFIALSPTRVLAASLICGGDVLETGTADFEKIVSTLVP
jgi:hypothetical protein